MSLESHPHNPPRFSSPHISAFPLFIGGHWVQGHGEKFHSIDPATGIDVWEGASADGKDVESAIVAARKALPQWAARPLAERIAIIEAFKNELETNKDELATTISQEMGKPLWDSKTEVAAMIGKVAISIRAYEERTGRKESAMPDGTTSLLFHKPHGVVAVFGPYNFPGHLPNGHIVPALIAGNTVIFKPSEITPRVAELTIHLWEKAGIPAGVLNLVQGEKQTGIALANHPHLDGLFFTGSSATGVMLHKQFAGHPQKILALEMGGNNPLIYWDSADVDAAVFLTIQSAFLSSGQRCTCARRLIVKDDGSADAFLKQLVEVAGNLAVDAWDAQPQPFMGPLVSLVESEKLMEAEQQFISHGAKALLPLQRLHDSLPFLSAGILDVTDCTLREDKEFFGPLLQVIRVKDFDAALHEANNTVYGLAAGLISESRELFHRFAQEVRAGVVNWNRQTTGASSAAPFGGVGLSGNHRPSAYYATDYCAYPIAVLQAEKPVKPTELPPGLRL